jgi:hypothetical protein
MDLKSLTYISVPYSAIKIKTHTRVTVQSIRVSSSEIWLHSDHVKFYGEHVDGEEATADIYIPKFIVVV